MRRTEGDLRFGIESTGLLNAPRMSSSSFESSSNSASSRLPKSKSPGESVCFRSGNGGGGVDNAVQRRGFEDAMGAAALGCEIGATAKSPSHPSSSSAIGGDGFTEFALEAGCETKASNPQSSSKELEAADGLGEGEMVDFPSVSRPSQGVGACDLVACRRRPSSLCLSTSAARSAMVIRAPPLVPTASDPVKRSLKASPLVDVGFGARFSVDRCWGGIDGVMERELVFEEPADDSSENTSCCGRFGTLFDVTDPNFCGCTGFVGAVEFQRSAKESDIVDGE